MSKYRTRRQWWENYKFFKGNLNQNKRFKDFKKKTLLSEEDSNEEYSDPDEEGESLFMAEIVNTSKSESSESETLSDSDEETDLEEKLLKSLQELKWLKKIILNHENNNKRLQEEKKKQIRSLKITKFYLVKRIKKLNALKCSFEESSK